MKGKHIAHRILSFALLVLCLFSCGAASQAEAPRTVSAAVPERKEEEADMIGKYDFEIGTYRLENRIQQGEETLDWNHIAAFFCLILAVFFVFLK